MCSLPDWRLSAAFAETQNEGESNNPEVAAERPFEISEHDTPVQRPRETTATHLVTLQMQINDAIEIVARHRHPPTGAL